MTGNRLQVTKEDNRQNQKMHLEGAFLLCEQADKAYIYISKRRNYSIIIEEGDRWIADI